MSNPGWLIVCKRCGKGEVEGFWLEQCEFWDGKEMATATVTHWTGKQDELWREACPIETPTADSEGQPKG